MRKTQAQTLELERADTLTRATASRVMEAAGAQAALSDLLTSAEGLLAEIYLSWRRDDEQLDRELAEDLLVLLDEGRRRLGGGGDWSDLPLAREILASLDQVAGRLSHLLQQEEPVADDVRIWILGAAIELTWCRSSLEIGL